MTKGIIEMVRVRSAAPQLVVWDVDRTLLDAGPATHDAFQDALRTVTDMALPSGPGWTGRTDPDVIRAVLRERFTHPARLDRMVAAVLRALPVQLARQRDRLLAEGRALPGVRRVLAALASAGIRQTVLTGNVRANALLKLRLFGLVEHLDLDLGAYGDDAEARVDLLPLVLDRVRAGGHGEVDPDRVWLIGDTPGDLACARAGRVRCLLVGTGLYPAEQLARLDPDGVAADLTDLNALFHIIGATTAGR